MTSGAGAQLQFRNMQPPSKVIHLRNLPWECNEEELIELCKPFGKVMNTKVNVGANRNQAFVEFGDMSQAMSMISYYASASEPAQIRGRTVYLQYSNRQEIINSKSSADTASNVLLVTIEGVEANDVSIDVLHLVFSAFGFVHKIATFEKTAGFQALVQFSDPATASSARMALDGRSIPRYLLPDHVGTCHLHITFSAHNDLTVKFQSHRSRDYTNPYLPVASSAINSGGQSIVGSDGKVKELESNVLLASIENMQYTVTIDVLHTVFSTFGTVQKIVMFEKEGFQALVQYPDIPTAVLAKEALEGHCIYDGGYCKLHLAYSRHTDLNVKVNNDRSRDYTNPNPNAPSLLGQHPSMQTTAVIQVAPPVSIVQPSNQFMGVPQQRADAVAAQCQIQGWGFVTPQLLPSHQGMTNVPVASSSSVVGSVPYGVSTGRTAAGAMFPQQAGANYAAPSGYGPIPVAFSPVAEGQTGIGILPGAAGSIPHLGHSSAAQPLILVNQPQALFPAPAATQMGVPGPVSGPSSF